MEDEIRGSRGRGGDELFGYESEEELDLKRISAEKPGERLGVLVGGGAGGRGGAW